MWACQFLAYTNADDLEKRKKKYGNSCVWFYDGRNVTYTLCLIWYISHF